MNSQYQLFNDFLQNNVLTPFYDARLKKVASLNLSAVLKSKNPYLFKAKNLELAGDFVKSIVDAYLSSQEETLFGNLLETFAIFVSQTVNGGFKSNFRSVDLEFQRGNIYYIVGIKSGTNWGNADQIAAMKNHFKEAKSKLREQGITDEIVAVNGCMYGVEPHPLKDVRRIRGGSAVPEEPDKVYYKYAGQDFWYFVSGDDDLYRAIIQPIDQEAKKKDAAFKAVYTSKVNAMTEEFILDFMAPDNLIDWVKLIDYVSKRRTGTEPPQW